VFGNRTKYFLTVYQEKPKCGLAMFTEFACGCITRVDFRADFISLCGRNYIIFLVETPAQKIEGVFSHTPYQNVF